MLFATTILSSVAAGFVAQLVDGSLGMGFGTITMTFLLGLGIAPAVASASVNVATIATGAVSAASHHRLQNVHWPTTLKLGIPGAVGGFAGAWALASLTRLDAATPVTSAILIALGAVIVWRFVKGAGAGHGPIRGGFAIPTGLVGGFLAAVGGGGWGPVTMPITLTTSRLEPHRVVGSVSTAQVFASTAAVLGFWMAVPDTLTVLWPVVVGMAVGGMAAAPLAAWLTRKIPTAKLGSTIGMLVVALNLRTLLGNFDVPWPVVTGLYLALAAVWALVLIAPKRTAAQREAATAPAPVEAEA
ncbi:MULTISPECIES: sulfite exporter TauE/SafE family protein [Glycomyces]|uniref:Probable membrane transporter protein n=2 Tax=Glycomyces TaxID=58113 RepID=A0A9X3SV06_9ACTN|nr:sulfite exporter TauE/SafE family protein [Glycomyces lechevalierae]MDA1386115.1 sulfite exporter TauE/SafE family protein [Glycomyces lechevalierae]MDR7338412.1 putative membrane protein YfcA [Glycomyces lechevalierae]